MVVIKAFGIREQSDIPIKLSSRSGGKAKIKTRFHSYKECTDEQGVIRPYKVVHWMKPNIF